MNIAQALHDSWQEAVAAYQNGEINSECTLHSIVFSSLRAHAFDALVFCEPQIDCGRDGCLIPDIVIASEQSVIAIVELKFVPHGYPVYELDLRKLTIFAKCEDAFTLRLEPTTGRFSGEKFTISPECILAFAAIGRKDADAVDEDLLRQKMNEFGHRFVPLVASI